MSKLQTERKQAATLRGVELQRYTDAVVTYVIANEALHTPILTDMEFSIVNQLENFVMDILIEYSVDDNRFAIAAVRRALGY